MVAPTDTASRFLLIQCYCYWDPATKHRGVTFTNLQWGYSQVQTVHQVWHSTISSEDTHQVHQVRTNLQWGISPSSPSSPSVTFTNMQCVLHQMRLLQVHRSLISTATSTSALFTNLHCTTSTRVAPFSTVELLQLHHPAVNLHLFRYYFVWLCYPTIKWSCNYATHQQPCCRCEYACQIFICIIEIQVLATIQNMLPPVVAFNFTFIIQLH